MTIRLTIKLYGTLGLKVPDYDHLNGIQLEVPQGTTPADLLNDLQVPLSHVGLISRDGKILKPDTVLGNQMTINFFSLISGG